MTAISRVDLLQLLNETPISLRADLGGLLGFGLITRTTTKIVLPSSMGSIIEKELELETAEIKQSEFIPLIWYLDSYQPRNSAHQPETRQDTTKNRIRQDQPKSPPLFSSAQQQVLWDQCLKHQQFTKRPDIPAAVKLLSQVKPVSKLPKLVREANNQETLLFLDRSNHLAPIWEDQLELAESLQKLMGIESSQVLLMLNGISGTIQKLWDTAGENWSYGQLPEAARLLFITDLGFYSRLATEQQAWENSLEQLKTMGHTVSVLNPLSRLASGFSFDQLSLDNKASQFSKLQLAMVGCLQAKLSRIRQLRQQVTDGCLADELRLWNHPDRMKQATGMNWRLDPEYLVEWAFEAELTKAEYKQYEKLQASWRASLAIETEGLEQLIEEVLDADNKPADASLLNKALDKYEQDSGQQTGVFRWLFSQKELITVKAVAQHIAGHSKWDRLNRQTQAVIEQTQGTQGKTINLEAKCEQRYIKQLGPDLLCIPVTEGALISSNNVIFDRDNGDCLELGARLSGNTARLRTLQADMQLKTMIQPDWSERFWQDPHGLFAVHCDNALFFLQPASAQNPQAQWLCRHKPWSWASAAGIDEHGLWADMQVKEVVYRLRWIKPGQFLMGSPEQKNDSGEDEIQHLVTLSQGYWMGQTSCTQALWQAVMGKNPSSDKDDVQLPVESISWNDCQNFISRLQTLFPDFSAQLPSEAQWEYACRAGSRTAYWWGDDINNKYANNGSKTEMEMQFPANDFGLKSMSGNVFEWCADRFGAYSTEDVTNPSGPETGRLRVLRGGSWYSGGRYLRSAYRFANEPGARFHAFGFRLAGGYRPSSK